MRIEKLKTGYRVDYKFVEDGQLKYATTPVFEKKKDLNQKLTELNLRPEVEQIVVTDVRFF